MARDTLSASGWLPVEALDDLDNKREAASREEAARLVALPPRGRVLELMRLLADKGEAPLRAADLCAVLDSFEGTATPTAEELKALFPALFAE